MVDVAYIVRTLSAFIVPGIHHVVLETVSECLDVLPVGIILDSQGQGCATAHASQMVTTRCAHSANVERCT